MDMKVDARLIRAERERRAWSQEHLASVAGLGLRTIQRIEATGLASYESVKAIASAFDLTASDLHVQDERSPSVPATGAQKAERKRGMQKLTQALPTLAFAMGVLGASAIAVELSRAFWWVGALLLASSVVGARVLENVLLSRGRAGIGFALFLASVCFLTIAVVAYTDPSEAAMMIPLMGGLALPLLSTPSCCVRRRASGPSAALTTHWDTHRFQVK